eukprot:6195509-Pleurochrysis_carterae.AAC.3
MLETGVRVSALSRHCRCTQAAAAARNAVQRGVVGAATRVAQSLAACAAAERSGRGEDLG